MRCALFIAASLVAAPAMSPAQPCAQSGTRTIARKADLPAGALEALALPMAERGARWQATDMIEPGARLPGTRFILARLRGCHLAIRYERGGIAHTYHTAVLERRSNGWAVLQRD